MTSVFPTRLAAEDWTSCRIARTRCSGSRRGVKLRDVFGIFAFLSGIASIAGCRDSSIESEIEGEPPPQPPNCPDLPELASITRQDGSISDVRILSNGTLKFYIPSEWLRGIFFDTRSKEVQKKVLKYTPLLYKEECPGIVHLGDSVLFSIPVLERLVGPPTAHFDASSEVVSVQVAASETVGNDDAMLDWPSDRYPTAQVVLKPGQLRARYLWPDRTEGDIYSERFGRIRGQLIEVSDWLLTPPRDRDESKVFKIG